MKISILVPTRERPDKLKNFLECLYKDTHKKKNIEILIAVDNDDPTYNQVESIISSSNARFFADCRIVRRNRSEFLNRDYYNWMADQATGDLIWCLADDVTTVRNGWDTIVIEHVQRFFEQHPDRIVCVSIKDNTPPPSHRLPKFPCFPMFSREAINALGWMLPPNIPTWGADYIIYTIYHPLGRVLQIHDQNYINHVSWHTKQIEVDATNERIGAIFNKMKMIPEHNTDKMIAVDVPILRDKLRKIILRNSCSTA